MVSKLNLKMKKPIISLTSDFAVQSQGVGAMEGAAISICPDAYVLHLMHGLPEYNITAAARTMETAINLPQGYHVCVCDPGVGTKRRAIAIEVKRGDFLIGPDNGVLIPASRILGGIKRVHELTNPKYMKQPVSPIFHGRDIFTPAAAHLANGVGLEEFGLKLNLHDLVKAPYEEAVLAGDSMNSIVIWINKFGSLELNISTILWDEAGIEVGDRVFLSLPNGVKLNLPVVNTFGEVKVGEDLILKDDYGRIEVAINMGQFAQKYNLAIGDPIKIEYNL